MPIYEYRCDRGHTFEVMQRMSDDPVSACTHCSAPVHRVFHPVAVHFKGSGFYNTDYGKRRRGAPEADGAEGPGKDGGEAPKKDGAAKAPSEAKAPASSGSASGSAD